MPLFLRGARPRHYCRRHLLGLAFLPFLLGAYRLNCPRHRRLRLLGVAFALGHGRGDRPPNQRRPLVLRDGRRRPLLLRNHCSVSHLSVLASYCIYKR